jgi:hypothetical protein
VSRWGLPESVCETHRREADELRERLARGCVQVDRAVEAYRGRLAA